MVLGCGGVTSLKYAKIQDYHAQIHKQNEILMLANVTVSEMASNISVFLCGFYEEDKNLLKQQKTRRAQHLK